MDQTAQCLRSVPASDLVNNFGAGIPGVVDGSVLTESIGTAIAHGQFARVPILNGITHDEEMLFVDGLGLTVSGGTFRPLPRRPGPPTDYQTRLPPALGVADARAPAGPGRYPPRR